MSNLKVMIHRLVHSSCQRSQEQIVRHLQTLSKHRGRLWDHPCVRYFEDKLTSMSNSKLGGVLTRQCNVIAAHRVRRSAQILALYRNLYGKKSGNHILKKLGEFLGSKPKGNLYFLLGAVFFDWKENRVTDEDLERVTDDMRQFIDTNVHTGEAKLHDSRGEEWEKVVDNENFKLWRCQVSGSSLYKYKVYGTYKDLPARAFFNIQMDLEYRKQWDNHVIQLDRVDVDKETGTEVIYWATHFPLGFLYARDYVYVRRHKVNAADNTMVITGQSVDHPSFPQNKDYVRVGTYTSHMLIKPHKSFDDNGFDYVMSYYDDPQLYVPTWAINKMTLSSLPAFIETLHAAAVKQHQSTMKVSGFQPSGTSNSNMMQARLVQLGTNYGYMDQEKN